MGVNEKLISLAVSPDGSDNSVSGMARGVPQTPNPSTATVAKSVTRTVIAFLCRSSTLVPSPLYFFKPTRTKRIEHYHSSSGHSYKLSAHKVSEIQSQYRYLY